MKVRITKSFEPFQASSSLDVEIPDFGVDEAHDGPRDERIWAYNGDNHNVANYVKNRLFTKSVSTSEYAVS